MATKAKGGPLTTTKEKRVTSPSSQSPLKNTAQRGIKTPVTTPKSASPSSPSPSPSPSGARRTSSTSSPSYARNVSKSGPESCVKTPLKPVMSRRSSLDKPLPPKSRVSVISKSQLLSSPSSARSTASSSSSKPLVGRLAKARSFTSEKESRTGLRHDVKKIENLEAKSLSPKETINEIVEINDNNNNHPIDTHTPENFEEMVEKVEDLDSSMISYANEDPDDIKSEVIVLEDNNIEPEIEVEEVNIDESSITIIPPTDKIESFDSIPNEEQESNTSDMEEQSIIPNQEDAIEEVEEEVEDEKTELPPPPPPPPENQELNEKEDKADQVISNDLEIKESEPVKEDNKIKKGGENGGVKKQVQVVQGKREASVVSNDAIEETATKLREQRVNRVRALAGAFETVISNQ